MKECNVPILGRCFGDVQHGSVLSTPQVQPAPFRPRARRLKAMPILGYSIARSAPSSTPIRSIACLRLAYTAPLPTPSNRNGPVNSNAERAARPSHRVRLARLARRPSRPTSSYHWPAWPRRARSRSPLLAARCMSAPNVIQHHQRRPLSRSTSTCRAPRGLSPAADGVCLR